MNKKLVHCCEDMRNTLDNTSRENMLKYEADIRGYFLILYEKNKPTGFLKPILYCPWCGTELPEELDEEWGNFLEKEYGLSSDGFFDENGCWDESKIPAEFRTDEWWKKRGL